MWWDGAEWIVRDMELEADKTFTDIDDAVDFLIGE